MSARPGPRFKANERDDARAANLHPFAPHGWLAVGAAATLLVWSFAGWEAVTHLAAEFADPTRDLRRATTAALALIGALYLGLAAVLTGLVLAGLVVTGADVHPLVLATTACLAAIYAVGCAAGVRLLPRGSAGRRAAVAATVLVAVLLLLLAGPFVAWPLVLATGALATRRLLGRRVPKVRRGHGTGDATPPTHSAHASSLR